MTGDAGILIARRGHHHANQLSGLGLLALPGSVEAGWGRPVPAHVACGVGGGSGEKESGCAWVQHLPMAGEQQSTPESDSCQSHASGRTYHV
eukprot:1161080-Pelagomonas_calceolata.AAC.2